MGAAELVTICCKDTADFDWEAKFIQVSFAFTEVCEGSFVVRSS